MSLIHSALPYLLWIVGNLVFLIPLHSLARRCSCRLETSLVQTFILYFALVEGVVFLLALSGILNTTSIISVMTACGLSLWMLNFKGRAGAACGASPTRAADTEPIAASAFLFCLFVCFCLLALLRAAVAGDATTDGLWYHLPRVYGLVQEQSLAPLGHPFIDASHPKGPEFWFYWNFVLFGSPTFTTVSLLPFLSLALVATYSLARSLGASAASARYGALAAAFAPVIAAQLGTTYTDIMTASLIVAAISLSVSPPSAMNRFERLCFALCLGLLLNSKLSAIVSIPILGLLWLFLESNRSSLRETMKHAIAVCTLVVLFGGYTYFQNFITYGNPIYPQDFRIGPITFAGPAAFERMWEMRSAGGESALSRALQTWLSPSEVGYASVKGGYGVMGLVLLPVLVAAPLAALVRRNLYPLGVVLLCSVLLYVLTPLFFVARFGMFILFVAGACLAILLQALPRQGYARMILLSTVFLAALSAIAQQLKVIQLHSGGPQALSATCPLVFPEEYRSAIELAQHRDTAPQTWLVVSDLNPIAFACFWGPTLQNKVYLFQLEGHQRTLTDIRKQARARQATRILIPKTFAAELPQVTRVLQSLEKAVLVDDSLYKL